MTCIKLKDPINSSELSLYFTILEPEMDLFATGNGTFATKVQISPANVCKIRLTKQIHEVKEMIEIHSVTKTFKEKKNICHCVKTSIFHGEQGADSWTPR